jgi:NAD-dependent SIR2 family protein deacetylase
VSKIIIVLGAGASEHCGTPLMRNFLEVAQDLWRKGFVSEVDEHFSQVFDAIRNLQQINSKAKLDTYNIETIYAAFEMGKLLKSLPGIIEPAMIDKLIYSLKVVISYTLEKTTQLPTYAGEIHAPLAYSHFAAMVRKLLEEKKSCSLISFNYDLGLDYALFENRLLLDYALEDMDTKNNAVTLLKLHGSLNWGKCQSCGKVLACRELCETERTGQDYSTLPIISQLKKLRCCSQPLEPGPFIVPPTWNKTALHAEMGRVWERAASELKDAENIFVLGYSLPSTDYFFNYLFALGVDTKTILRKFYVFDINGDVKDRFINLLGSGVIKRFQYFQSSFEDAVMPEDRGFPLGVRTARLQQVIDTI